MSVVGADIRVISLGLSCQVAHQIRQQLGGAAAGESFHTDPMYFDYIITPFLTLLRLLLYPFPELTGPDAIDIRLDNPHWPHTGIAFVHNFRTGGLNGTIDIDANYTESASKIAHLRQKFLALDQDAAQLVFIIGNAQHDLPRFCDPGQLHADFGFTRDRIHALLRALHHRYGPRLRRLIVVENTATDSGPWTLPGVTRHNSGTLRGPPDALWTGNTAFWHTVLAEELFGDEVKRKARPVALPLDPAGA